MRTKGSKISISVTMMTSYWTKIIHKLKEKKIWDCRKGKNHWSCLQPVRETSARMRHHVPNVKNCSNHRFLWLNHRQSCLPLLVWVLCARVGIWHCLHVGGMCQKSGSGAKQLKSVTFSLSGRCTQTHNRKKGTSTHTRARTQVCVRVALAQHHPNQSKRGRCGLTWRLAI